MIICANRTKNIQSNISTPTYILMGVLQTMLGTIVDTIILIGAVCGAIYKTWEFFAKPTSTLKQKAEVRKKAQIKEVLEAELPAILKKHDLEVRDKYKADRQRYLEEIKDEVLEQVKEPIDQNKDDLEALKISAKDVLREKIMAIYHKNKRVRELEQHEREALDQYYKDYKKLNGNSYIDKYYGRMKKWKEVYDDYIDDDE